MILALLSVSMLKSRGPPNGLPRIILVAAGSRSVLTDSISLRFFFFSALSADYLGMRSGCLTNRVFYAVLLSA
jgi:hypothetical protein